MKDFWTRRNFVLTGTCGALGLAVGSCGVCYPVSNGVSLEKKSLPTVQPNSFPYFEVSGTPEEIGLGIGRMFGDYIKTGLQRRAEWFGDLKTFAGGEGKGAYETFLTAAGKHAPRALSELRGWAKGSEIPFEDLMVLNLKAELGALKAKRSDSLPEVEKKEENPGCSTVVTVFEDRICHLHNEDGHDAYRDLMFVLDVKPDDGVPYVCLSYPGILPGNAPGINANGLVQTTNFIACKDVRLGLGRYFIDRMILEAKGIEEALQWSSHKERAFGFHHVFSSIPEKRSVAIEVSISRQEVKELKGLYFHTNHLVFDSMKDEDQDEKYVGSSSSSRYEVISKWAASVSDPEALGPDQLIEPLASHEGKPYSPCRHPEGDIRGFTLATAIFEAPSKTFRMSKEQPCLNEWVDYNLPSMPL